jgi:hypothetical protein
MGSVGDVSMNSETSKANLQEEEDNEPVDMQALLDKDQSTPFSRMSETEYVPKTD